MKASDQLGVPLLGPLKIAVIAAGEVEPIDEFDSAFIATHLHQDLMAPQRLCAPDGMGDPAAGTHQATAGVIEPVRTHENRIVSIPIDPVTVAVEPLAVREIWPGHRDTFVFAAVSPGAVDIHKTVVTGGE